MIKRVRRECPMSLSLFTAYVGNLQEMFSKLQVAGVMTGRNNAWMLAYADDMVVIAKWESSKVYNEEGI